MTKTRIPLILLGTLVLAGVFFRAGLTRSLVDQLFSHQSPRPITLRVWDWWSPASNEEYGQYFEALEHRRRRKVFQNRWLFNPKNV